MVGFWGRGRGTGQLWTTGSHTFGGGCCEKYMPKKCLDLHWFFLKSFESWSTVGSRWRNNSIKIHIQQFLKSDSYQFWLRQ